VGNFIPPNYVLPGIRWGQELLDGYASGVGAGMSESGFVKRDFFETHITEHFAKYAGIEKGSNWPTTLILYDGHTSHISRTLTQWARERSVVLFVLPPHSSHLTQSLDVVVFGPIKQYYYRECMTYCMHNNPGRNITRYDEANLSAKPYVKALSPEQLVIGFGRLEYMPLTQVKSVKNN